MERKQRERSVVKTYIEEYFTYQYYFCRYFTQYNPEFGKEIKRDLIPLHLEIFGKHHKITNPLSEFNRVLSNAIIERDYEFFALEMKSKLEFFYQIDFTLGNFREKCDALFDKTLDIIKRHKLFFESEKEIKNWIIHAILCQIEANTPNLIPYPPNIPIFPREMLQELWRTFPKAQQVYLMLRHKELIENYPDFDEHKHHFENLDAYFESPNFLMTLPPPIFQFRNYDIFEDINSYEKMAVKSFQNQIKIYLRNIKSLLKKYGFKRNKSDNYDQTEWLVIWNKEHCEYLWEITSNIPELEKLAAGSAVDRLRKAFNKFEDFGLPIRPFGNKRKNSM